MVLGALLLSSPYLLELHMGQVTFVTVAAVAISLLLFGDAELGGLSPRWRVRAASAIVYTGAVLLQILVLGVLLLLCEPAGGSSAAGWRARWETGLTALAVIAFGAADALRVTRRGEESRCLRPDPELVD